MKPSPLLLLATLAGTLVFTSASAEKAASVKTGAIEASVEIDDRLKAHPGLFANLLAEGRREIQSRSRKADKAWREEPDMFRIGRWTHERSYLQLSVAGRYVSILRADDSYSGGAHPNLSWNTILWDREAKKRVSIRPFFKETADNGPTMKTLARHARLSVAAEKIERTRQDDALKDIAESTPERLVAEDSSIRDGIQPQLLNLGPIALAASTVPGKSAGLTFHYGRYAVGAYAEGVFEAFVHWSSFREHLSPEGLALFAGERPESD